MAESEHCMHNSVDNQWHSPTPESGWRVLAARNGNMENAGAKDDVLVLNLK